jgi:hypothetical protein
MFLQQLAVLLPVQKFAPMKPKFYVHSHNSAREPYLAPVQSTSHLKNLYLRYLLIIFYNIRSRVPNDPFLQVFSSNVLFYILKMYCTSTLPQKAALSTNTHEFLTADCNG